MPVDTFGLYFPANLILRARPFYSFSQQKKKLDIQASSSRFTPGGGNGEYNIRVGVKMIEARFDSTQTPGKEVERGQVD